MICRPRCRLPGSKAGYQYLLPRPNTLQLWMLHLEGVLRSRPCVCLARVVVTPSVATEFTPEAPPNAPLQSLDAICAPSS